MIRPEGRQLSLKADEHISPDELPDPTPLPQVFGWCILLRPVAIRSKTKGGLILPDSTRDDIGYQTTVGRVLAIGPLAWTRPDLGLPELDPWYTVGSYVGFPKYGGIKMVYKSIKLLLLDSNEPRIGVDRPEYLDPVFEMSK